MREHLHVLGCIVFILSAPMTTVADSLLAEDATLEKLAEGYSFTEGPASDAAGNVYFTDQPNDRILMWRLDGTITTYMQPCGRSNGLCVDDKGCIWACADEKNELWRIDENMKHHVILTEYEGKPLNGPNDLWIAPDGGIYFSDPFYKRDYWKRGPMEQECQGVYYVRPGATTAIRLIDNLKQPNGLIGTPDGKTLYVTDIQDRKTWKYSIATDGSLTDAVLFCELGSDGMTIDRAGNVYLTGDGVIVFDKTGKQIEHIKVPEPWTANVCFGGAEKQWLFVTACKGLYRIRTTVPGVGSQ